VRTAALARIPDRPELASEIARAAFVDVVWRAAELDAIENPALALRALWATGYVLAGNDGDWVTLEIPPLAAS
jgi:hypothetical protein